MSGRNFIPKEDIPAHRAQLRRLLGEPGQIARFTPTDLFKGWNTSPRSMARDAVRVLERASAERKQRRCSAKAICAAEHTFRLNGRIFHVACGRKPGHSVRHRCLKKHGTATVTFAW